MSVSRYVCPSIKSFSDLNEIWYGDRGRWLMYDPIQWQGQGHGASEVRKLHFSRSIFSAIYNGSWQVTTDSQTRAQYLNLIGPDFWYLAYFLCHMTLNLEGVPEVSPSTKKFFFDFNEIWCVDRGRWLMHNGMPYPRSSSRSLSFRSSEYCTF